MGRAVCCSGGSPASQTAGKSRAGFRHGATLNCQKLTREMQTLPTSDSQLNQGLKNPHARHSELPFSNCFVSITPPKPLKTLGWKETATSSTSVSHPLGGAGGQRVATLITGMAFGHLLIKGQESGSESSQGSDKLLHPALVATALSALASGFYSTPVETKQVIKRPTQILERKVGIFQRV